MHWRKLCRGSLEAGGHLSKGILPHQLVLHRRVVLALKVHKIENFFGFDFEFYTVSLLVMLKYEGFVTKNF
jgi:hypothetical protein